MNEIKVLLVGLSSSSTQVVVYVKIPPLEGGDQLSVVIWIFFVVGLVPAFMVVVFSFIVKALVVCICVALGVGFYTLVERKVLSYIQLRKGPNKVGIAGLPQPLADALKLFSKEGVQISFINKFIYVASPVFAVVFMLLLWGLYVSSFSSAVFKLGVLFFLCVSRLNVYTVLFSGWGSNSKYALLGAIRAVAQTISYEVSMALVLMVVLVSSFSFDFFFISSTQRFIIFLFLVVPFAFVWFVRCLAETNRAPFDLAEGESELVSGFNIEYGGGEFAFLFIAEYGSILLISFLRRALFLGGALEGVGIFPILKFLFLAFLFLWVRGSYPRMRYDTLISLTWKNVLTSVLGFFCLWLPLIVF